MRFILITAIGLLLWTSSLAQVGNEWINFNQPYFKIPVGQDGFYRLAYTDLVAAGVPSSIDPETFQLFHRGIEQAIFVEGEGDNQFNNGDYIEFYGRKNDGTQDTELYNDPLSQPHKYYNLFSDTTSYFLTYGSIQGKRMAFSQPNNPGLSAEMYHWDEKLMILKDQYSAGIDYGEIQSAGFDIGEGWMGNQIVQTQTASYTIEGITNGVTSAALPVLEVLLTGRGPMNHAIELYAGARLLTTLNFSGYESYKHVQTILWSDIVDEKVTISAKVIASPDRISVGYVILRYPQAVDMSSATSKIFSVAENGTDIAYLEILNPAPATRLYDISDPDNTIRVEATQTSTLNAIITGTASQRKILATNTSLTPAVKRVTFRTINPAAHNFIIVTHPLLRKPAAGYTDPVKAYAEYRSLPQGGSYDTLIVNIGQLYDQFNYGEPSPLAIFHFMEFMASVKLPEYLFLIGKGLNVNYNYYRSPSAYPVYKDYVPTSGYPGSDAAFTAGLDGGRAHGVATGRLTAVGPEDVAVYLNKVKESESLPFSDLRRKNILHLSGGVNPGEPQLFRFYLEQFAAIAKTVHLGGNVKAIAKQSTDIELINVAEEVNEGLNLITFFGHSSAASSDFDIGFVTDPVMGYNNKGKYPLLLMNGCSAGSFFLNNAIFGENWVNSSNKGAIGIIAHTSFGFSNSLRNYSELIYKVAFGDEAFINKGIGDVQKEVARRFLTTFGEGVSQITQVQQMVLLGDPAVKLFGADKPDYEIKEEHVTLSSFDGEPITALTDSFKLNFIVQNFGKAQNEDLTITVTRILNDGSSVVYDSAIRPVLYSDTISFTLPGNIQGGFGTNDFSIFIDSENSVDELREDNNLATLSYFIPLNGTKNLYPDDFAIVTTTSVTLSLQHTDMLSGERAFLVELDTTDTFDSPFKKQFEITGTVLASMKTDLLTQDTLAYYWRTKLLNPLTEESKEWDVSSFTYIKDAQPGWAQVHFPQYATNTSSGLVQDVELRRLSFEETVTQVALRTFGSAVGKPADSVSLKINGLEYNIYIDGGAISGCRNNTINFVAFDKTTTQPYPGIFLTWYDILFTHGGRSLICGREPYVINSFMTNELVAGNDADIVKYIDNIPSADSVIIFNIGDAGYENWPLQAKQKLSELGISEAQIDGLSSGEPIVIRAKKDSAPGTALIYRTTGLPENEQTLINNTTVTGRINAGIMNSTVIGPALRWDNFYINYDEVDDSDLMRIDITGIKSNGEEVVLKTGLTDDEDLSDINAAMYPNLKIAFKVDDEINLTPVQLGNWIVTYQPVAEGLLLYKGSREARTLFEGQMWNGDYTFINISDAEFADSLVVDYDIVNPQTFATTKSMMRISAPLPGDTSRFIVPFTTIGQEGLNNVSVFVNPGVEPELGYDNNFISLNEHIDVIPDTKAPVLDVTIDGRHIIMNEYVSSSPDIHVVLWDNNPYLYKRDTTGINIFITYPCEVEDCPVKAVYFSDQQIEWKAETDTSEFAIVFTPEDLPDGTYTLRVEARDAHGNSSGADPYAISFKVKNETTAIISNPFPNPFHYKTSFEFILSGNDLPSSFDLNIITMNGKPIQQFTEDDIGDFHIGTNQIEWNAKDEEGNELPNGIYFYQLTIFVNEKSITKSGKLVLVR